MRHLFPIIIIYSYGHKVTNIVLQLIRCWILDWTNPPHPPLPPTTWLRKNRTLFLSPPSKIKSKFNLYKIASGGKLTIILSNILIIHLVCRMKQDRYLLKVQHQMKEHMTEQLFWCQKHLLTVLFLIFIKSETDPAPQNSITIWRTKGKTCESITNSY